MKQPILHLIIALLCNRTHAAEPLMEKSLSIFNLSIQIHGGGMLSGEKRRQITLDWRDYMMPHDQKTQTVSGNTV